MRNSVMLTGDRKKQGQNKLGRKILKKRENTRWCRKGRKPKECNKDWGPINSIPIYDENHAN